jgi:hypothetical protein
VIYSILLTCYVLEALHSLVLKILRPLYAASNNEEAKVFFRTASTEYRYELIVKKDVIEYERLDRIKLETGRRSALHVIGIAEKYVKGNKIHRGQIWCVYDGFFEIRCY